VGPIPLYIGSDWSSFVPRMSLAASVSSIRMNKTPDVEAAIDCTPAAGQEPHAGVAFSRPELRRGRR